MTALTNFMKKKPAIKKIYLINQDYSFGHSVADAATSMLKSKRPDIQIVGNEFVPLLKVTAFSPYIAKIKASGADSVITGNWGQDFALLLKASADAGLKVDWYTYYASIAGGPTAIKQAGPALQNRVFVIAEGFMPTRLARSDAVRPLVFMSWSSPIAWVCLCCGVGGGSYLARRSYCPTKPVVGILV